MLVNKGSIEAPIISKWLSLMVSIVLSLSEEKNLRHPTTHIFFSTVGNKIKSHTMKIDQLILPLAIVVAAIILRRDSTKLQIGGASTSTDGVGGKGVS